MLRVRVEEKATTTIALARAVVELVSTSFAGQGDSDSQLSLPVREVESMACA